MGNCVYHDSLEHSAERRLAKWCGSICKGAISSILDVGIKEIADRSRGCFPGSARVFTPNGFKLMSDLKVGDYVLTHAGYSPVYLFGHSDPFAITNMVNIKTASAMNLSLTADHYVPFVNGTYATAQHVQVGDSVWVKGPSDKMSRTVVTTIGSAIEVGLFNPYPHAGTIVVDGILASAHSSWLLEGMMPETHVPTAYDILLTPVRILHLLFPGWLQRFAEAVAGEGSLDQKGVAGIAHAAMMTIVK